MILQNYMNADTTVKTLESGYLSLEEKQAGTPSFTICLCDDNTAFIKTTDGT